MEIIFAGLSEGSWPSLSLSPPPTSLSLPQCTGSCKSVTGLAENKGRVPLSWTPTLKGFTVSKGGDCQARVLEREAARGEQLRDDGSKLWVGVRLLFLEGCVLANQ